MGDAVGPHVADGEQLFTFFLTAFRTICLSIFTGHNQFVKFLTALRAFKFINGHLLTPFICEGSEAPVFVTTGIRGKRKLRAFQEKII